MNKRKFKPRILIFFLLLIIVMSQFSVYGISSNTNLSPDWLITFKDHTAGQNNSTTGDVTWYTGASTYDVSGDKIHISHTGATSFGYRPICYNDLSKVVSGTIIYEFEVNVPESNVDSNLNCQVYLRKNDGTLMPNYNLLVFNSPTNGLWLSAGGKNTGKKITRGIDYKFRILFDFLNSKYTVTMLNGELDGKSQINILLGTYALPEGTFAFSGINFQYFTNLYLNNLKVFAVSSSEITSDVISNKGNKKIAAEGTTVFPLKINQYIDADSADDLLIVKKNDVVLSDTIDYTLTYSIAPTGDGLAVAPIQDWRANPVITLNEAVEQGDKVSFDFSGIRDVFGRTIDKKIEFSVPIPSYKILKNRMQEDMFNTKSPAADILNAFGDDGKFSNVDYTQNRVGADFGPAIALEYLKNIVIAYASLGNPIYKNAAIKSKIDAALTTWASGAYDNPVNWWYKEIDIPTKMATILLCDLPEAEYTERIKAMAMRGKPTYDASALHFSDSDGGGNTANMSLIGFQIGAATANENILNDCKLILDSELKSRFLPNENGVMYDNSFQQHQNIFYSGSYGTGFVDAVTKMLSWLDDTDYMVSQEAVRAFTDFILDGQQYILRSITSDFNAAGRAISRPASGGVGATVRQSLVKAVDVLLALENNSYRISELKTIKNNRLSASDNKTSLSKHFWESDYTAFHRPDFFVGIRGASTRLKKSEYMNSENKKGYFLSDGTTAIIKDGTEYDGIYPVWDWNRIPGTTSVQIKEAELINISNGGNALTSKSYYGESDFVGGVSDGVFAVSAVELKNTQKDTALSAKKSYFLFDEGFVALGNGISNAPSDKSVVTSLNQTLMQGDVKYNNGTENILPYGTTIKGENIKWVLHRGIGYIFNDSKNICLETENKSGNWSDIGVSSGGVSKDVFSLYIDHGVSPNRETYDYTVLGSADSDSINEYISNPNLVTVSNNENQSAVWNRKESTLGAVFWKSGTVTVPAEITGYLSDITVTVDNPCVMLLKWNNDNSYKISVADPTQSLVGKINVTINDSILSSLILPDGAYAGSTVSVGNLHNIHVQSGGGGEVYANYKTALKGTSVTLTAVSEKGYKLKEWQIISDNVALSDENKTIVNFNMPESDVKVIAVFEPLMYTVTMNHSDGGVATTNAKTVFYNTTLELKAEPDELYWFKEWQVEGKETGITYIRSNPAKYVMPAEDVVITPVFEQTYDLTYDDGYNAVLFEETFERFSEGEALPTASFTYADGKYQTIVKSPIDEKTHGMVAKTITRIDKGSPVRPLDSFIQTLYPASGIERAKHLKFETELLLDNTSQGTLHAITYSSSAKTLVSFVNGKLSVLNADVVELNSTKPVWVKFLFYVDCEMNTYTAYITIGDNYPVKFHEKTFEPSDVRSFGVQVDKDADGVRSPVYVDNMKISTYSDEEAVYESNSENVVFEEDFSQGYSTGDNLNSLYWNKTDNLTVSNLEMSKDHGLMAKMTQAGTHIDAKTNLMSEKYPDLPRIVKFEFDVYTAITNNLIYIRGINSAGREIGPNFVTFQKGYIRIGNADTGRIFIPFEAKKWYSITIYVDTQLDKYDTFVNGVYAGEQDITAEGESVSSARIKLQWTTTGGDVYVDNYKISVIEDSKTFSVSTVPVITREGKNHGKVHYKIDNKHNEVTLIVTTVSNNQLNNVLTQFCEPDKDAVEKLTIDFIQEQNEKLNVFVWDSFDELTPLVTAQKNLINYK